MCTRTKQHETRNETKGVNIIHTQRQTLKSKLKTLNNVNYVEAVGK